MNNKEMNNKHIIMECTQLENIRRKAFNEITRSDSISSCTLMILINHDVLVIIVDCIYNYSDIIH